MTKWAFLKQRAAFWVSPKLYGGEIGPTPRLRDNVLTDQKDMVQSAHQLTRLLRGNMQTNTDHQAATESIRRICGQVFRRTNSPVGLQVGSNITAGKISRLLVLMAAILFLHLERGTAFELSLGQIDVGHWDSLEKEYNPQTQTTITRLSGNSASRYPFASFVVKPQAGDAPSGTVQLKVGYRATNTQRQDLLNYAPAPFDYRYTFSYAMQYEITTPHLLGPYYPLPETDGGTSFFLLEAPIGVRFYLEFFVGGNVHDGWNARDWHPTVINPALPGTADLFVSGRISTVSIEVVPEPTTAAMLLLGASLLGLTFRRRRAR